MAYEALTLNTDTVLPLTREHQSRSNAESLSPLKQLIGREVYASPYPDALRPGSRRPIAIQTSGRIHAPNPDQEREGRMIYEIMRVLFAGSTGLTLLAYMGSFALAGSAPLLAIPVGIAALALTVVTCSLLSLIKWVENAHAKAVTARGE